MDPELWLAMQSYYLNGNAPALYNTGEAPNPDAPELDPYAQYVYATGAMPSTNKKGELLPYNLDYQKSLTNYQQDVNQMLADPMNALMASLVGGEGFAPGVFDPVAKETPIKLTQTPVLQQMASAGGYQGTLAQLMLPKSVTYTAPDGTVNRGAGMNPASATALLQRALNAEDGGGILTPEEMQQIKGELPPVINNSGFNGPEVVPDQYDWKSIAQDAQSLWQPMAQEQAQIGAPGVVGRDGQFFSTEQIDSPQTEFLKKLGIPNPSARYDLQYAMENDPAIAGLFMHSAETQTQAENMRETFKQYTKKIAKQRETEAKARADDAKRMREYQQGPLREWSGKMDTFRNQTQQAMSDYFRDAATSGAQVEPGQRGVPQWRNEFDIAPGQRGAPQWRNEFDIEPGQRGAPQWRSTSGEIPGMPIKPAQPAAPSLSMYSRDGGMTADEVAALFNKGTQFLPKMFRPEAKELSTRKPVLAASTRAANKAERETGVAYMKALIPYLARNAAGRTPAKDVIQQRLQPLYASGAFGQQGLPTAYPNPAAVRAMMGG